jgi:hypothetical protein
MRERKEKVEGEWSETLHLTGETNKFSVMKVPRQCPLVLLVKVG